VFLVVAGSTVCVLEASIVNSMGHVIVQDPMWDGPFNSWHLDWEDGVAHIKSYRLQDFVLGEGACYHDAQAEFVVRCSYNKAGVREPWLEYKMYYCKYGTPERGKKSMNQSDFIQDPSMKSNSGPGSRDRLDHDSIHRDCQCRFSAIKLVPNDRIPSGTTKLLFKQRFHVNREGRAAHGTRCSDSVGLPSQMAHKLSPECR
jgi:hypothetical protein